MAVRILLSKNGKKKVCGKYTWNIVTERFKETLNLAMCKDSRSSRLQSAFIRKQGVIRKNLVIPEIFSTAKIIIMDLKMR